jgi:hypothetical protein
MTNNDRAHVSTPQQSAQRASVDTPAFQALAEEWACADVPAGEDNPAWVALIAHINAWSSAGSGAIPDGWVSVAQRLPEFGQTVLIRFAKSGHIEDATFHQDEYSDGWTYCLYDGERLNDGPSHWMPLPAAPSPAPQGEQA